MKALASTLCLAAASALVLIALAVGSAAATTAEVATTFRGSVFMVDGVVDPATVKVTLAERGAGASGDVAMKSTYLQVPQKFYKTFQPGKQYRSANGQGRQVRPQGEFNFEFHNVPAGTHTLDVVAVGVIFQQYRIDVSEGGGDLEERVRVSSNQDPNKMFRYPLKVKPAGTVSYFDQRSNFFSLSTLMKNPMYVIMGVTALAAVFLPRMLDKDALEEMQREMARMQDQRSGEGGGSGRQAQVTR